jgi:hypothetical protein
MTGTLLTTIEVAERLGLSGAAIAQAVRTGALQPSARTNEEFLFTERAVAMFAEQRAEAAAAPLEPPAAVSRSEWSGDLDRLNAWLRDLSESAPASSTLAIPTASIVPAAPPVPVPIATPEEALPAVDFRPPPLPVAEPAPVTDPEPRPPEVEPEPAAVPEPEPPATPPPPRAVVPDPAPPAATETPSQTEPVPDPPATVPSDLSRQALLIVQPIVRFRVLRDVTDRLATVRGIADARLERLESGVASYRLSFEGQRPDDETIGGALASLNLEVILVDSAL